MQDITLSSYQIVFILASTTSLRQVTASVPSLSRMCLKAVLWSSIFLKTSVMKLCSVIMTNSWPLQEACMKQGDQPEVYLIDNGVCFIYSFPRLPEAGTQSWRDWKLPFETSWLRTSQKHLNGYWCTFFVAWKSLVMNRKYTIPQWIAANNNLLGVEEARNNYPSDLKQLTY